MLTRAKVEKQEAKLRVENTLRLAEADISAELARETGKIAPKSLGIRASVGNAKQRLASRALAYVDLHMLAARAAAKKGDHRPAAWALEAIGAVERANSDAGPRFQVAIGLSLPGLQSAPEPHQTIAVGHSSLVKK